MKKRASGLIEKALNEAGDEMKKKTQKGQIQMGFDDEIEVTVDGPLGPDLREGLLAASAKTLIGDRERLDLDENHILVKWHGQTRIVAHEIVKGFDELTIDERDIIQPLIEKKAKELREIEAEKYIDPGQNPMLEKDLTSKTDTGTKHPDVIDIDQIRQAAHDILTKGLKCKATIELINDEYRVNGERLVNLDYDDVTVLLDAVAQGKTKIQEGEKETEAEKYLNPEKNPLIKIDPGE